MKKARIMRAFLFTSERRHASRAAMDPMNAPMDRPSPISGR